MGRVDQYTKCVIYLTVYLALSSCVDNGKNSEGWSEEQIAKYAMERVAQSIERGSNSVIGQSKIKNIEIKRISSEQSFKNSPYASTDVYFEDNQTSRNFYIRVFEDCEVEWVSL